MIKRALKKVVEKAYAATHHAPPPDFMRVAYRVPRTAVLMTAKHGEQRNVWPIDWHLPLSLDPELYGVCLGRGSFGAELVAASEVFVVNFVPASWEDVVLQLGRTSGRDVDKFAASGLSYASASSVDGIRLIDSLGRLECDVVDVHVVGDHTLYVGAVRHSEPLPDDAEQLCHVDSSPHLK